MRKKEKAYPEKSFTVKLLKWNRDKNFRKMPWKGEKNPYKIWLSEIILQQTRVEQGLNYYHRFIKTFPNIYELAKAPDQKIFKLWEGLGYYSRCRNLIASARDIALKRKGVFPNTYEEIKKLKGVGPYTAAAISSFAFNLPHAVIDGNVYRVLSRVFGIHAAIDSAGGKDQFAVLANELLDKKEPGKYNQAIMDFGATVCKAATPLCDQCVFRQTCYAFLHDKISELPVKKKKLKIKTRWFYFLVLEFDNKLAIRQRTAKDIWQYLFEFPLIEVEKEEDFKEVLSTRKREDWLRLIDFREAEMSGIFEQQLSHQLIKARFIKIKLKKAPNPGKEWEWVNLNRLNSYAFPKLINAYFSLNRIRAGSAK